MATAPRQRKRRPIVDLVRSAHPRAARSATPCASSTRAVWSRNPVMFVGRGRRGADDHPVRPRPRRPARRAGLHRPDHRLAVVHRAVRQLRRGGGRGPRQGAGRRAAPDQDRDHGQAPAPTPTASDCETVSALDLRRGDVVLVEAGDIIPGDGEVIEGIASVDESAITGESAPVIRESGGDRSRRHRRHQRALRLDQGAHHHRARRDLPRPHDRAGRGRRAAEDAERDRAQHPARRPDHHLPHRDRRPSRASPSMPAARCRSRCCVALLVSLIPTTIGGLLSAIGIAGMDRLVQVQRARHVRPRRRGGGRRRHAAARQDRHHHARQPHGDRVPPASPASAKRTLAEAAQLASLADETPEGRSIVVLVKGKYGHDGAAMLRAAARQLHPVHRRRRA